ncbi:hypothetical protein BJ875DRAFT_96377 [Amylocarpus encephaloides]|uniref:GST N-terminal domain-containing protein n=1 Tax=Amylocarpus encephaloides TaxID=45428 RepID=A0A9P8C3H8_9HELO|nr:hypothetical protein BJ875DRAFT_96377 [Amylocarpus encephaloides]
MEANLGQLNGPYRPLQSSNLPGLQQHDPQHLGQHAIVSQAPLDLTAVDHSINHHVYTLDQANDHGHAFGNVDPNAFDRGLHPHLEHSSHTPIHDGPSMHDSRQTLHDNHQMVHVANNGNQHAPQHANDAQFGLLAPNPIQHNAIRRLQQDEDLFNPPPVAPSSEPKKGGSHLPNKCVPNPPKLEEWRQRLFDVDSVITLSEDEFNTYFPHVDNVYSHRSTQRYKRKPFVSHYWDCRLKGRPPGTPKSDDPTKKKRKRTARERDLCDVKIKITEYHAGAMQQPGFRPDDGAVQSPASGGNFFSQDQSSGQGMQQNSQTFLLPPAVPADHPGAKGAPYYTIQRVNGNGGNGKGDGIPGPHKHDLAESDRVKKNSVQRTLLQREKEDKKQQKHHHKKASGLALATVRKHSKDADLKLYGSCFCPFTQRVWIAMEAMGLQYQYIEVDSFKKPQTVVNRRGIIPVVNDLAFSMSDSAVLLEYLHDCNLGSSLLPPDPGLKAHSRYWANHVNGRIVPVFYRLLQEEDLSKQTVFTKTLQDEITKIVQACDHIGPYFLGNHLSYVDIHFAPWMIRLPRVLKQYRQWQDPQPNSRWAVWMHAIENNDHIKNTTSGDDLYRDSYERYAHNPTGNNELADLFNGVLT